MKNYKNIILLILIFISFKIIAQKNNGKSYSTQYFISEPAFNLKQGEIQYSNIMLFYNDFKIGITDHFSAGVSGILFGFFSKTNVPVSFRMKISQPLANSQFHVGAGLKINTELHYQNFKSQGYTYEPFALLSFGNYRNNINVEMAFPYGDKRWLRPNYKINGKLKITKRTDLIGEYFFSRYNNYSEFLSLFGGRTYFKKWAWEYGLLFTGNTGENHLGFIYPFIGAKLYLN